MRLLLLILLLYPLTCLPQQRAVQRYVEFDHLYIVIPEPVYQRIITDTFVLRRFCAVDKGYPAFAPIDTAKKEAYFRFANSYFELMSTGNRWQEPLHKAGIGWIINHPGGADSVWRWLQTIYGPATRNELQRSAQQEPELHTLYIQRADTTRRPLLDYWIYEYYPVFLRRIYGPLQDPVDITAKSYRREKSYSSQRLAKEVIETGLRVDSADRAPLLQWLEANGYALTQEKRRWRAEKGHERFCIYERPPGSSPLYYLKLSLNRPHRDMTRVFSADCRLEIRGEVATWWF